MSISRSRESYESLFRDYAIAKSVNDLEKRVKEIEKTVDLKYGSDSVVSTTRLNLEEYKKMQTAPSKRDADSEMKKLSEEMAVFKRIKTKMLSDKTYCNKYVAIKNGKVVDFDLNNLKLAQRINRKFPNEVVLLVKVKRGERLVKLRSPRVLT